MDVLTVSHVIISLIGIASGFVVMYGLLTGKLQSFWTAVFLTTTVLTSATGFLFPFHGLKPPHILGIISLVVLAIAIAARYAFHLRGAWRWIYVVTAAAALYFNCFVAVVQAFEKDPALKALAPKQTEPPFVIAQVALLVFFITLGVFATTRFHVVIPSES